MKIGYSKKRLFSNLLMGTLWLGVGISYFFEQGIATKKIRPYFLILLGLIYLSIFIFDYTKKYFEISDGKIKINTFPKKEINIEDIRDVKYYADDYTFKTSDKQIKIQKSQINSKDLPEFESFFNTLKSQLEQKIVPPKIY